MAPSVLPAYSAPGVLARPLGGGRPGRHRARKAGPDQERGQEQRAGADEQLPELRAAHRGRSEQHEEHLGQPVEDEEHERAREPDASLDQREAGRRGPAPSPSPGVERGAAGDADQERDEHRREGVGRAADDEGEGPRPRHLVDHRYRAGDGERHGDHRPLEPGHRWGGFDFRRPRPRGDGSRCRGRRTRGDAHAPAEPDGEDADHHVAESGDRDGRAVAHGGEQEVARCGHADHGAERVDGVQESDRPADRPVSPGEGLGQDRQRAPHQRGREEQERRDEEELDEGERGVGNVQQAVEIGIDGGHQPEQQGQERAVDADRRSRGCRRCGSDR